MKLRSTLLIISLQTTSLYWIFLIITGLIDNCIYAENSVYQNEDVNYIMQNSSEVNKSISNSSIEYPSNSERRARIIHNLEYTPKKETPNKLSNNSDPQDQPFENEVEIRKNLDKVNFNKKSTLQSTGRIYNKSPTQGKRETYETARKASADANQYDAQDYKDYYQQQQQEQYQQQAVANEYTEGYSTIPSNAYIDEYKDYKEYAEGQDAQHWRNSYYPTSSGPASYGCSCYKQAASSQVASSQVSPPQVASNRQTCDNLGATFLQTLLLLLGNLWQLIQIAATSAIPFIIPILALKLIIVPIKIFKFLQLIKFFCKLFIILPFVIRVIYPAISEGLGIENWLYTKDHHPDHEYDHSESRVESNGTGSWHGALKQYIQHYSSFADDALLRSCPSKVACELGAFLSTSTTVLPEKLSQYLINRVEDAEEAEETEKTTKKDNSLESEKESAIRAFIISLGRKWSMEQCAVYTCSIVL